MKYIPIALTLILTSFIAYQLHSWDVDRINKKHEKALVAQAEALNKKCDEDKLKTKEASNAYQQTLSNNIALRDKLINSLRDNATVCVSSSGTATGSDGKTSRGTSVAQVGVKASTIINEAAQCDDTRERLIHLQDFIQSVYSSR